MIILSPFRLVDGMPSAFSIKRRDAAVSSLAVRRDRRVGAVASSASPVGMVQWLVDGMENGLFVLPSLHRTIFSLR